MASETANARQPSEHAQQSTPNRIQRSSHHTEKGRLLVYVHKLVLANLLWSKVDHVSAVRPILHLHGAAVKHLPLWVEHVDVKRVPTVRFVRHDVHAAGLPDGEANGPRGEIETRN